MTKTKKTKQKKKNKKKGKTVLHFMKFDNQIHIMEYSNDGTKLINMVDNAEHYLRDQLDANTLYDIDNRIIIDDAIKDDMTKEGQKRFGKLFCPAKTISKKLSAKFSF